MLANWVSARARLARLSLSALKEILERDVDQQSSVPLLRTRAPNQDEFQMSIPFAFESRTGVFIGVRRLTYQPWLIDKLLLSRTAEVELSGFIILRFSYIS